jgi:hypothetical protein
VSVSRANRVWLAIVATAAVAAAVVIPIAVTSGGGSSGSYTDGPRPVTSAEADRLSTMRLTNFEAVGVAFHATIVAAQGSVTLNGDVDFHTLVGYGEVSGGKGPSYTLQWNAGRLLAWPSPGKPSEPPPNVPTTAPRERAIAPSSSAVDSVLALLLGLGESRPDNAKQVQQDGARWLRTDTVDGQLVDVMQGPSNKGPGHGSDTAFDFWVDRSGHLLRVDAFLGGSTTPTRIDLDPSSYTEVQTSPYLTARS